MPAASGKRRRTEMLYRVARKSANLLKVSLVTTAAMLAICLLALVETTNTAEATSLPENGKIAFTNYDEIYTVEPDGSNPRPLIKDAELVDRPVWSPDGTKIVFTHQQESSQSHLISVMNADGSDLRALYTKVSQFPGPTWSPDGTKLAFSKVTVTDHVAQNDIVLMDLDGSNLINVTKTPGTVEANPDFSPDGSQMCLYRGAGGLEEGIFVTNVDSSNHIRLIDSRAVECAWSPDGKRIATQHYGSSIPDEFDFEFEVYVMNADGSGKTNLTSNRARDENLDWSPDGTKITFASDRDGDYDIYTMDADGSDVAQVTNLAGDDLFPDWQPLPRPTASKSRSQTVHPPDTGGPSLLLVASALLFSGGTLLYAGLRRSM